MAGWNGELALRLNEEGQKQGTAVITQAIWDTIGRWKQAGAPAYINLPNVLVVQDLHSFDRSSVPDTDNQMLMRALIKAFNDKGWVSLTPNQQRLLPQIEEQSHYDQEEDDDPYA